MYKHTEADNAGWNAHRNRQSALDTWLAREDALAAAVESGRAVDIADLTDPAHALDGAEREAMLRAAFMRWTTTWEGVLHTRLELGDNPVGAIRVAQDRALEVRAAEWRAIQRAEGTEVAVELVGRHRRRVAQATGLSLAGVERLQEQIERTTAYAVPARLRIRRARRLRRTLVARRAV